jgi:hypothetical protein
LEHSKQCPSFQCFSLSASVITLHATADVSMAFGLCGGRHGLAGCMLPV